MSVVSPKPKRCWASRAARFSGSFMWGRFILIGVQMAPGEMEFTRTFFRAISQARCLARFSKGALVMP